MKKNRITIIGFVAILILTVACGFVAAVGVGENHQGSAKNIKLGLDLAGGVSITYEAADENPSAEDMSDTVYKLQKRVEVYSTEAEVYQEGSNRINVDIPGEYDADAILEDLGNPGTIRFCEAVTTEETKNADGTTNPSSVAFNDVLSGEDVANAQVGTQNDDYGNKKYVVSLSLTSEGAKKFAEATERNINKVIYIIYDGEIISSPVVRNVISDGQAMIDGMANYDEANSLATTIRLGVLKLELNEIRSNVVGAKLGQEAIATSLKAGAIGFAIIIVFMIVMYLVPGIASGIALCLYVLSMLCLLNGMDITLTLPGIAGIILSIGMAVDANVIIFTRIREEIAAGKTVKSAIQIGYKKALSAILDGNITTLIAAAVLYLKGSGTIKGFATTLAIGIFLSMFTALVISRIIVMAFYEMGIKDEKFYGRQKPAKVCNYTGKRAIFYLISLVVIAAGLVTMGIKHSSDNQALNYSLDFTGGTSMTVPFNEHVDITSEKGAQLRTLIEDKAGTSDIQLQNVSGGNDVIIKTQVLDNEQRTALKDALVESYGVDDTKITEESISSVVSGEMQTDAVVAILISAVCMLIYIWIRFKDIRFGAGAVIALLHDILVVLTLYAIVRIPVGNTFIACMLTIVGYSINATIVIFDRIRENRRFMQKAELSEIVNISISQTLSRSINTSLTTFIMIFMLYIMGVTTVKEFALPLIVGVVCGAYSSICIAGTVWYALRGKRKSKA